jgi:hypothetical protein
VKISYQIIRKFFLLFPNFSYSLKPMKKRENLIENVCDENQHQSHIDSRAKIISSALLEKVEKKVIREKIKRWH